jgi:hypothetical protein
MAHQASNRAEDPVAVASYVATLSGDLADLARRNGLDTLGYLLDMVHVEAVNESRLGANDAGR